jgi:hypothetical protein
VRSDRAWRRFIGRRLILNLATGTTIVGRLIDVTAGTLVVDDAELLAEGRSPLKVDGRSIIAIANVDFGQVVPT